MSEQQIARAVPEFLIPDSSMPDPKEIKDNFFGWVKSHFERESDIESILNPFYGNVFTIDEQRPVDWRGYEQRISRLRSQYEYPGLTKATVVVPVAAGQESTLTGSLESYAAQNIDPNEVNFLYYLNLPKAAPLRDRRNAQKLARSVHNFAKLHPTLQIGVIEDELDSAKGEVNLGYIKKVICDVAVTSILDAAARETTVADGSIVIVNDADIVTLSPNYLNRVVNEFGDKSLMAAATHVDFAAEGYLDHPEFLIATRAMQYLRAFQYGLNNVVAFPPSYAFRPSAYIAAGGISPIARGMDVDLANKLANLGGQFKPKIILDTEIPMRVSERRALHAFLNLHQGDLFKAEHEYEADRQIRGDTRRQHSRPAATAKGRRLGDAFTEITLIAKERYGIPSNSVFWRYVIEKMGVEYEHTGDNQLRITGLGKLHP